MPTQFPKQLTVNEYYVDWMGSNDKGGFFYYLKYYADNANPAIVIPFLTNTAELDLEYHGNISGGKIASCLLERIVDVEFFDSYAVKLAALFWKINGENLLKEFRVYSAEYNPIENYRMLETGSDVHTGEDATTNSGGTTDTRNGTMSVIDYVQGFNSDTFVPSDKSDTTYTNYTLAHVDTTRSTTEYDSGFTHRMERSGNIGVTTSQNMIDSEIKLWMWNFYYKVLFPAVDRVLTIPIY